MPGCVTKCTSYRTTSIDEAWEDIRDHFGPRVAIGSTRYNEDIAEWEEWANNNGVSTTDASKFGKWLVWRCAYGTAEYGNLPTRKRDHTGISCVTCPYDSNSDSVRTRLWLDLEYTDLLPTRSDHGTYYMRVAHRGNSWGFECTSDSCPYYIANGTRYFHV
jgi:hypothetical protein